MARIIIRGYRETDRAFRKMSKELADEFRDEMKQVAEPIAADARGRLSRYQGASLVTIRPVALAKGVAVRQHKNKVTGKRGDFGGLQMKALLSALDENQELVEQGAERALDRITSGAGFEREGNCMADKLIIDGAEFESPDDFTIGEARILKRYTGMNLAQVEGANTSDPDFMAAVIHIAYARTWPAATFDELEGRVNNVKLATIDARGDDVDPPTIAPSPATNEDATSSGEGGNETGDPSQETSTPNVSGMQGLDTGATSLPTKSQDSHPTNSTVALT